MNNSTAQYYEKGTILYTIFATVGEVGILDFKATCNQAIAGIKCFDSGFLDYLYYYLKNLKDFMLSQSKGNAQVNINQSKLKAALIAVPPLAEQERIVQFINEIFNVINQLDNNQDDYANSIEALKKAILQSAIQGTLVEQCEDDEPAAILLERIREEKRKQLGKKYVESYIFKCSDNRYYEHINGKNIDITEEIPFDLPNGWQFERLGNIIDISSGKNITSAEMLKTEQIYPVYGGNGITGYYNKYNTNENTVVIGRVGFYCGSIHITNGKSWITDNALIVNYNKKHIMLHYMEIVLRVADFGKKSSSTAQPLVTGKIIKPYIIGIPPLAEQKRIVEKIDEIFTKL